MVLFKKDPIGEWWKAFEDNASNIAGVFENQSPFDLMKFIKRYLNPIDSNLMWEFGPAVHTRGHRLVITPEYRKDLRPLVREMLRRAPPIPGWEFYPYRLPEDFNMVEDTIESRIGQPIMEFFFSAETNEFYQIDLVFFAPGVHGEQALDLARHQAFVLVENFMGEEVLDKWIGAIEVETKIPNDRHVMPAIELQNTVCSLIEEIKSSLPNRAFYQRIDESTWTLFELKPVKHKDYPRQIDMFVGMTTCVPLWKNTHSQVGFFSERFSKLDEVSCYLKMDGRDGLDGEYFADRAEIEDALDDALIGADCGCHIGGGTGLCYSYIDLALTNLEKGIEIVRDVLRKGNLTRRSWIQFFDSDHESEWVGIWDNSPPPPMPDFEREAE